MHIMDTKMSRIEVDMRDVKKDLRFHIKRTEQNEQHINNIETNMLQPLQKDILKFKIIGSMIATTSITICGFIGWLINIYLTNN